MELGSINDKLVKNHQQAQIEKIMAITKVLGLRVGSQFLADVQKATQATPEERAQLIKHIEANLAQLNKNSAAPAIKALINELEAQKQLAQNPNVKLVALSVNTATAMGSATPNATTPTATITNLLTYTNQPIQPGQTLLLQLNTEHRLQLLQLVNPAELAALKTFIQANNTTTNNFKFTNTR